jgi:ribosome-binding factor A
MVDAARARKLADRIQQIVAEMLERRIKDPRLGFVTVTDTRITNDLRDATVYYTVYGSDGERAETAAALESAKGVIRTEVGRKTGVRHTPSLTFVQDSLMENVAHIDDLLAKARARDEEVAKAAQGATHAGDANPYRVDEDTDGDEVDETGDDENGDLGHSSS